jgi:TolA-binding protein
VDEADNARQRLSDDLTKQIGDLNFRLDNGGGASPSAAPRSSSPPPALPPGSTMSPPQGKLGSLPVAPPALPTGVRRTPELAMQEGSAALARRDYATAEAAAREVLANPRNPRAADAQFLLAQALAGRRDNQAAAIAYDDTYNRSPSGPHAQDALLGLANALSALGDKAASCAALDKLRAGFPQPRPDVREGIAAARGRAGCR